MKDNYFTIYGNTKSIVNRGQKFARISVYLGSSVLLVPLLFSYLSYLGTNIDIQSKINGKVLGVEERIVSAEEEYSQVVIQGRTLSQEDKSRIINKMSSEVHKGDRREIVLRAYLETVLCSNGTKPPLANYTKELVESSDKHGLDWRYTTAIAGVETWFGCAGGADGYKNAWGYGGGPSTRFRYNSWPEGIEAYTAGLVKGYGTKIDFYRIASFYTRGVVGRNDPWADGVHRYLYGIDSIDRALSKQ